MQAPREEVLQAERTAAAITPRWDHSGGFNIFY